MQRCTPTVSASRRKTAADGGSLVWRTARRNAASGSCGFGRSLGQRPCSASHSLKAGWRPCHPRASATWGESLQTQASSSGSITMQAHWSPHEGRSRDSTSRCSTGGVRAGRSLPRPVKHHQGVAGLPTGSGRQLVPRVVTPRVLLGVHSNDEVDRPRHGSTRGASAAQSALVPCPCRERRRRGPASLQDTGGEQRAEIQRSLPLAEPGMLVSADDVSGAGLVLRKAEELARLGEAQDDGGVRGT